MVKNFFLISKSARLYLQQQLLSFAGTRGVGGKNNNGVDEAEIFDISIIEENLTGKDSLKLL